MSARHHAVVRVALAAYLFVHFVMLVPFAGELFSREGVVPDASLSPLAGLFPNVLAWCDAPWSATALLALGAGLSVALGLGEQDRPAAVLLWYLWACLVGRNPLISNPSIPYVGWLLLAHAATPRPSQGVRLAAWAVLALGYSYSGLTKLASPSWLDGTALGHVLTNPLARPTPVRDALLALPTDLLRIATWLGLFLEVAFAPLALSRRLRPSLWFLATALQLSLLVLIDFADLTLGMLLFHLFTFDPAWLDGRLPGGAADEFAEELTPVAPRSSPALLEDLPAL